MRLAGCCLLISLTLLCASAPAAQDLSRLRSEISSGDAERQRSALFEIRNIRTQEASRLAIPALSSRDEIVRATAAAAVIFLPPGEAAAALLPLMSDKAEFVRQETAYALGSVGDVSATNTLVSAVRRDTDPVRNASAFALGRIGDPSAIESLVNLLKKKPDEGNEFLRRSAARSIGQIAIFLRTGRKVNMTPQDYLPSRFKDGPITAPTSAFFMSAVPVLARVLNSSKEADDTRREAAFALGAIGDATAVESLRRQLNSKDPALAEASREALIRLGVEQ